MYDITDLHEKIDDGFEFLGHLQVAYLLDHQHCLWGAGPVEMVFT